MPKKKTNLIWGFGLAFFIIAIMIMSISQPFSVLSTDEVKIGADGQPKWVFFIRPSGSGEEIKFYSPTPEEMPEYVDSEGGRYVPQFDFSLSFKPEPIVCEYSLYDNSISRDQIIDFIAFWREDSYYFGVFEDFERHAPIVVKSSKSTDEVTIDGFEIGHTISFEDERDDGGDLIVEVQGGLVGTTDCKFPNELAVTVGKESGEVRYWEDRDPRDASYSRLENDDWLRNYDCEVSVNNNKLVCTRGLTDIGSGLITVTADAEYLDYRYYPPTVGKPKILSIENQAQVESGSSGSILLGVQNIGDDAGVFTIKAKGTRLTLNPGFTTISLEENEKMQLPFTVVAGTVDELTEVSGEFEMCTSSQTQAASCDSRDFNIEITTDKPENAYCGDKVCDLFETSQNCPSDCESTESQCSGNHMNLELGVCVCDDGFKMTSDEFGRMYCKEDLTDAFMIYGIAGVVLLGLILYSQMRKK